MKNLLFDFIEKYMPLTQTEKQALTDLDLFRSCKKGTVLLAEGQRSPYGYFVLKGCIRKYYVIDGEEKTTDFYTEMQGETPECVVTRKSSGYFLACTEDSLISVSTPADEAKIFTAFPRFETLCRLVSEDLIMKKQASFDNFKNSSPEQRYENLLAARPDLIQRVPQHQLASYLGMKPQSLSRIKSRLMKKKS